MSKIETELTHFEYDKLPAHMQAIATPFYDLAKQITALPHTPERSLALRKLLTARAMAFDLSAAIKEPIAPEPVVPEQE